MSELEELAYKLIHSINGDASDSSLKNVMDCFEGIITGMNGKWEEYLTRTTNEALTYDRITCPNCHTRIGIERTRHAVYTDVMQ